MSDNTYSVRVKCKRKAKLSLLSENLTLIGGVLWRIELGTDEQAGLEANRNFS